MAVQSGGFIAVSYLKLKEGATRRSESESDQCIARRRGAEEEEGEEVPVSELRCPVSLSRRVGPFTIEIPRHFSQRQRYDTYTAEKVNPPVSLKLCQ